MNHASLSILPMVISVLALLISFTGLYYSQVRHAKLRLIAGEYLNVNHFTEGNVGVSLPVCIINEGTRPGTIRRVGLLIKKGESGEGNLLEPLYFQRIDERGNFLHESVPAPLTVAASQSSVKQILFRSDFDHPGDFQFVNPGMYNFLLLGWTEDSFEPTVKYPFQIELSEHAANDLKQRLATKDSGTWRIPQYIWKKWGAHHLTELEVKALHEVK